MPELPAKVHSWFPSDRSKAASRPSSRLTKTLPSAMTGEAKKGTPPRPTLHRCWRVSPARLSPLRPVRAGLFWYSAQPGAVGAGTRSTVTSVGPSTTTGTVAGAYPPALTTRSYDPSATESANRPAGSVRTATSGVSATATRASGTGPSGPVTVPERVRSGAAASAASTVTVSPTVTVTSARCGAKPYALISSGYVPGVRRSAYVPVCGSVVVRWSPTVTVAASGAPSAPVTVPVTVPLRVT